MIKSKHVRNLLYLLTICLGAGAGAALAFLGTWIYRMGNGGTSMQVLPLVLMYGGMIALGALAGYLAAPRLLQLFEQAVTLCVRRMEKLSLAQLAAMSTGLIVGLVVAALLSRVLAFLGDSMVTLALSGMLYLLLAVVGLTIGRRRSEDFAALLSLKGIRRERRASRRGTERTLKLLDFSALSDGRLEAVLKTGFIEGELATAGFVAQDAEKGLQSSDASRSIRCKRAMELIRRLQEENPMTFRVIPTEEETGRDATVNLLALAREMDAAVITCDAAVSRAAAAAGVTALNLNDLSCALRMTLGAGDVTAVRIARVGKEAGQGVGYLEDGTMIVVEGGSAHVGQTRTVTVSSVLQTNAGRMVFARMEEEA